MRTTLNHPHGYSSIPRPLGRILAECVTRTMVRTAHPTNTPLLAAGWFILAISRFYAGVSV